MSVGSIRIPLLPYSSGNRWSDDYSGATIDSSYPITQAFDGNRSTASRVSATQTAMSVDLTNITVNLIELKFVVKLVISHHMFLLQLVVLHTR